MSNYEKDEFQELKLLKSGLIDLKNNLNEEIGFFLTTLDNATDPIQVLTSNKGRWLLTNPFLDTSDMINHLVRNISFRLYTSSHERFLTLSATISKDKELTLGFGSQKGDVLVKWKVFENTVSVPEWDKIIEGKENRERLIEELEDKEDLLRETEETLNSKDGLLNKGHFNLYLKRTFLKKKFNSEVDVLLDDLMSEVESTRDKLENIRSHDLPIIESEEICKLLDWLQLTFLRFPKIDNYKYYETMKKNKNGVLNE